MCGQTAKLKHATLCEKAGRLDTKQSTTAVVFIVPFNVHSTASFLVLCAAIAVGNLSAKLICKKPKEEPSCRYAKRWTIARYRWSDILIYLLACLYFLVCLCKYSFCTYCICRIYISFTHAHMFSICTQHMHPIVDWERYMHMNDIIIWLHMYVCCASVVSFCPGSKNCKTLHWTASLHRFQTSHSSLTLTFIVGIR